MRNYLIAIASFLVSVKQCWNGPVTCSLFLKKLRKLIFLKFSKVKLPMIVLSASSTDLNVHEVKVSFTIELGFATGKINHK